MLNIEELYSIVFFYGHYSVEGVKCDIHQGLSEAPSCPHLLVIGNECSQKNTISGLRTHSLTRHNS